MTWSDYPRDIELVTPLGKVYLTITDADHIYVDSRGARGRATSDLVVNGVLLNANAHLRRWGDGQFRIGKDDATPFEQYQNLYAHHAERFDKDASDAARRKIQATLETAITAWANDNASVFAAAAVADLNNKLDQAIKKRDEISAQYADAMTAVVDLDRDLRKARELAPGLAGELSQ